MRYIAGIAFVGALLQGNIELAATIAVAMLFVLGVLNLADRFRQDHSFSSFCKSLHAQLGADWVVINLRDAHYPDPAAIIFNPNSRMAHLVSTNGYGSTDFKSESIGEVVSVRVEELRPAEVIQPNALIRVDCHDNSRRFTVAGKSNWQFLQTHFAEFNQIT